MSSLGKRKGYITSNYSKKTKKSKSGISSDSPHIFFAEKEQLMFEYHGSKSEAEYLYEEIFGPLFR